MKEAFTMPTWLKQFYISLKT